LRVEYITGLVNSTNVPIKTSIIAESPANKIIQGDWIWQVNRDISSDPRSIWHNYKGKNLTIMAFGDSHAAAFSLPYRTYLDSGYWDIPPGPHFAWWQEGAEGWPAHLTAARPSGRANTPWEGCSKPSRGNGIEPRAYVSGQWSLSRCFAPLARRSILTGL
jgi:hypothetical protein